MLITNIITPRKLLWENDFEVIIKSGIFPLYQVACPLNLTVTANANLNLIATMRATEKLIMYTKLTQTLEKRNLSVQNFPWIV